MTIKPGILVPVLAAAVFALAAPAVHAQANCADRDLSGDFFEAAEVEDVTRCLDGGADPNARDGDGVAPLHFAARNTDNPAVIAALLDGGADPNARTTKGGFAPLDLAALDTDNPAVIAALLDGGADPNARNEDGLAPLHFAARNNDNPAVIAALLDGGADPNARDGTGLTPWDCAQENAALKETDAWWRLNDGRF